MFDRMLQELHVVITPGSGFGACGEGYFRISAFNSRENAEEVGRRLMTLRSRRSGRFGRILSLSAAGRRVRFRVSRI